MVSPCHDRISVNTCCFPGAQWSGLARAFDTLGIRRVSIVGMLLDQGLGEAKAIVRAAGLKVESIVHPFMLGHSLDAPAPVIEEERGKLLRRIEQAAELGARAIFMASGGRGSLTWEEAAEAFRAAIAPCLAPAADAGIALMVENIPPLYADLAIAHTLRDTVQLAEVAEVGVCLDVFSCWTEAGLEQTIERAIPRCHLVQVSDYVPGDRALPARAVPGDGAIPVARLVQATLAAGYAGAFDLELMGPRIEREGHLAATRRAVDRLDALLRETNA